MLVLSRRLLGALILSFALVAMSLGTGGPAEAASKKPVIKVQPKSVKVTAGARVTFTVKAAMAKKYQWEKKSKGKWKSISGAKRSKYSVTARSGISGTKYRVKIANGKKFRYSRVVTLSVIRRSSTPTPPPNPLGSRTNPMPVFGAFSSGAWTFALEPTDTNAWPRIRATNMFNDPPAPGYSYVMVAATATYRGSRTGAPWLNTNADFLGSNGRIYDSTSDGQYCGVLPESMGDVRDLYPGASARGNYCAVVPTSVIAGGLWRVNGDDDSYGTTPYVFVRMG
jgi:hypothetical protein